MMTSSFLPYDLSVRRAWRKAIQHLKGAPPSLASRPLREGERSLAGVEEADEAGYICRLPGSPSQLEPVTGGVVGLVGVVRPPVGGAATPPRGKSWGPRTLPSRFQPARTSDPKLRKFTVKLKSDFQYHPKLGVIFDLCEQQTLVQALLPTSGLTKNLGLACDWRLQYTIVTQEKLGHLLVASSIGRVDNDMMLAYCIKTAKEKKEGQKQTCQL